MANEPLSETTPRASPARPLRSFDRLVIVVLTALFGFTLGLAPFFLMIRHPQLLLLVSLGAVALSALVAWNNFPGDRLQPRYPDLLLAAISAVYPPASLGMILMILRLVATWTALLVNWLLAMGTQLRLPAPQIGTGAAYLFLALGGFAVVILATREIGRQLYPLASEPRTSAFKIMTRLKRVRLAAIPLTGVLLVAYVLLQVLSESPGNARFVILQLALMTSSVFIWGEVQRANRKAASVSANQSVEDLIRAAGFEVEKPGEGRGPAAERPLHGADFLAHGNERNLLVQVKAGGSEPVNWTAISALGTAAWAVAKERNLRTYEIEPVLVLVDSREQDALPAAAFEEGVKLLRMSHDDILAALQDAKQPRASAERLLKTSVVRGMGG